MKKYLRKFEGRDKIPKKNYYDALKGRDWISPKGESYSIDYEKVGNKYTIILIYKGYRMQISESDFNKIPIDSFIKTMKDGMDIK